MTNLSTRLDYTWKSGTIEVGASQMYHEGIVRSVRFGHNGRACQTLLDLEKYGKPWVGFFRNAKIMVKGFNNFQWRVWKSPQGCYPTCLTNLPTGIRAWYPFITQNVHWRVSWQGKSTCVHESKVMLKVVFWWANLYTMNHYNLCG